MNRIVDPIKFCKFCWPEVILTKYQQEIMYSVRDNNITVVVAGNQLGKDFVAGLGMLTTFLANHPVKTLTTSATQKHLNTLWGEMDRFSRTPKYGIRVEDGGPLIVGEQIIRKLVGGKVEKDSYVMQAVVSSSSKGEGLSGHHARHTLFISDEASAVAEIAYKMAQGWAKRMLIFGNPNPCNNFFFKLARGGDIPSPTNNHLFVKVIHIKAEDSPNYQLAKIQILRGRRKPVALLIRSKERPWGIYSQEEYEKLLEAWDKSKQLNPPEEILVPGVLDFSEYLLRRALWDPQRQCIGLDGEFYEGPETKLYPADWLNRAEQLARSNRQFSALTLGIDSGEGGANTSWAIVGSLGLKKLLSMKTPDTSIIPKTTLALMREFHIRPDNVLFDAGGGGKQHADQLRSQGYKVRTVFFGEAATPEKRRGTTQLETRKEQDEIRTTYKNRRAEMYGLLRLALDPNIEGPGFGIPAEYTELRRQLSLMPLKWDEEGRMWMLPKNKKDPDSTVETLTELLGCSPDEADALVLAVFGLKRKPVRATAGILT